MKKFKAYWQGFLRFLFHIGNQVFKYSFIERNLLIIFHNIKEQYGERISSRILESFHVFFLYGQDIRYQKRERQIKQKT